MAEIVFSCISCDWEDGISESKISNPNRVTDQVEIVCPSCGKSARPKTTRKKYLNR